MWLRFLKETREELPTRMICEPPVEFLEAKGQFSGEGAPGIDTFLFLTSWWDCNEQRKLGTLTAQRCWVTAKAELDALSGTTLSSECGSLCSASPQGYKPAVAVTFIFQVARLKDACRGWKTQTQDVWWEVTCSTLYCESICWVDRQPKPSPSADSFLNRQCGKSRLITSVFCLLKMALSYGCDIFQMVSSCPLNKGRSMYK